jgi:hypothetical protein
MKAVQKSSERRVIVDDPALLLCWRLIDYTLTDNGRQDFGFRDGCG